MIMTALIYKAALKGKDKHQLPVWLYKVWTVRTLFLDWFHGCFVPEVRKYFASKKLPFQVLLILDNTPGHPEPLEFNTKGTEVVHLPPNTSLIQLLDLGVTRTFNSLHTVLYRKYCQCYGKEPQKREEPRKCGLHH